MRTPKVFLVQIVLLGLSLPALAQNAPTQAAVSVPQGATNPAVRNDVEAPPRGTTMAEVVDRYGPPLKKHAAIGQPPITRWDYPGYHLYFENNRVLHAVVPGNPVPVVHEAELIGG